MEEEVKEKKPVNKVLIIILSILGAIAAFILIICLIIGCFIAYVGFQVYDATDKTPESAKTAEVTLADYTDDIAYKALTCEIAENDVALNLSEEELNILLYKGYSILNDMIVQMAPESKKYVTLNSMYCEFNSDGTITFSAPAKVLFFKTRISAKTNFYYDYENEGFEMTLSNVGLGKLTSSHWLFKDFLKLADVDSINKELIKNSIEGKVTQEKDVFKFFITFDGIAKLATSSKSSDGESSSKQKIIDLALPVLKQLMDGNKLGEDRLRINYNDDNKVGVQFGLESFGMNPLAEYNYTSYLEQAKAKVIVLLKTKINSASEETIANSSNCGTLYDYILRGYEVLSDDNKTKIDELDLSVIGITDNKNYVGIMPKEEPTTLDIMQDNIPKTPTEIAEKLAGEGITMTISQESLNKTFSGTGLNGMSLAFTNKDSTDIAYVAISSLYCEMNEGVISVKLILNVNGVNIGAELKLTETATATKGLKATFKLSTLSLGKVEVDDNLRSEILAFLGSALESSDETSYVSIDTVNETLTMDFTNFFTGNEYLEDVVKLFAKSNTTVKDGEIQITFKKS